MQHRPMRSDHVGYQGVTAPTKMALTAMLGKLFHPSLTWSFGASVKNLSWSMPSEVVDLAWPVAN